MNDKDNYLKKIIPLQHIKKGIYLLKISDSKGNFFVGKFIKQD